MEDDPIVVENIFTEDQITEIYENPNPITYVYEIIESNFQKNNSNLDIDSNMIMAISEFHVNNLIFIKEKFKSLPNSIQVKLLNLLNILLQLRHEPSGGETDEPNFSMICQMKLKEIKRGLYSLNLVYRVNTTSNNIYLKNDEIACLLEYIKTFYIPFIKLYYHFINIEKITENKRIEVIINRPLPVPPLSTAMPQVQEKHLFEEIKEEKDENVKNNNIEEKKEEKKAEEKKDDIPETYLDYMNKLNLNNETKRIISEKIDEMYKEIDYRIHDRQKKLDDKLKEVEDTIKGKKK